MRISDWSSDVCSSDLGGFLRGFRRPRTDRDGHDAKCVRQFELRAARREGAGHHRRLSDAAAVHGRIAVRDDGGRGHTGDPRRACGMGRSEEHTSELQSLMRISYAVFCLKKKTKHIHSNMLPTEMLKMCHK